MLYAPRTLALVIAIVALASLAQAECKQGVYGTSADFVVIVPLANNPQTLRYQFLDGRRGHTSDSDAPLVCAQEGAVAINRGNGKTERWSQMPMTATDTTFSSVQTKLVGRLIEPAGASNRERPLVVMVHGSERTSAIHSPYAYALAAQGIAVFVYDKRGTGGSEGEYTQNFELLAADAASALAHARTMARGRVSRAGFFGGSQGGWVAPLAATQSGADFVAVGFGLVASPIEEDREQMFSEARALGLEDQAVECVFRRCRPVIPRDAGHRFRAMPAG